MKVGNVQIQYFAAFSKYCLNVSVARMQGPHGYCPLWVD